MSSTLPGADVRAFYAALGVELPGWAHTEAPVRCFADPDAHAHGDRDASCSVSLRSGAFNCHGCGAHGGAYDAALAVGRSPREAIDLMVTHGLTQRRPRRDGSRTTSPASTRERSSRPAARVTATRREAPASATEGRSPRAPLPAAPQSAERAWSLSVSAEDVRRWCRALGENGELLARVRRERGWAAQTLTELGVGFDGERITVPVGDERGALQGLLRVRVDDWQKPKVVAAEGTRLGLIPHPAFIDGSVMLVEGPSDMLAARSAGVPAVAVPGAQAWRSEWADAFTGRVVTVVMDADRPGREAAARIGMDLERRGAHVRVVELAAERDDGYDLSDWLHAGNNPRLLTARWYTGEPYTRIARAGGDSWRARPGAIGPASGTPRTAVSAGPRAAVSAGAARPSSAGRSRGCATL